MAYAHDSSGRVLYESTSCVAVLLTRVATGLATLVAPGAEGTENVGGAATAEGQTMTQIIGQAKVLNTADHLCSCLLATGRCCLLQSGRFAVILCLYAEYIKLLFSRRCPGSLNMYKSAITPQIIRKGSKGLFSGSMLFTIFRFSF